MTTQVITSGNRAVVINGDCGRFSARMYVNVRDGLNNADATLVANTFKSEVGAKRWAAKKLAA